MATAAAANLNSVFLTPQMPMKHYYDLFLLNCQISSTAVQGAVVISKLDSFLLICG